MRCHPRPFIHRLHRLTPALGVLLALLQRTPVFRVMATAEPFAAVVATGGAWRGALIGTGALGALHSLAGATMLVTNQPSPLSVPAGSAIATVALASTGTVSPPNSWRITGAVPPGLSFQGGTRSVTVNATTLLLNGTPTTAGTYSLTLQAWEGQNLSGLATPAFHYTIIVTGAPSPAEPSFSAHPSSQTVTAGQPVVFSAAASGSPTYQWRKDGGNVLGATDSSLTLPNVQLADAGTYSVVATNVSASATSTTAMLTVTPAHVAPVVLQHPADQSVAPGATVMFAVAVSGTPAPMLQWRKDGVALAGQTGPILVLASARLADAGAYAVSATNAAGSVTSAAATLAIFTAPTTARLVNLSIRTVGGTGARTLILGVTLGGGGAGGQQRVFVGGVGPSLAAFGLVGLLVDPALKIFRGEMTIGANDDWAGDVEVASVAAQVGAFAFASTASKDAALVGRFAAGSYSIQIAPSVRAGARDDDGIALAELYDVSPLATPAGATPRFTNLSARAPVGAGADILIAGFVIAGQGSKTLLVRAAGPALGAFGVPGILDNPKLELFSGATKIGENDDWGGTAALSAAPANVGAFPFASPASRDAALVVTLPAGAYTVQVSGANATTGIALVELYELP